MGTSSVRDWKFNWVRGKSRIDIIGQNGNDGEHYMATQVGGDHYTKMKIQPIEYIIKNKLGYIVGNIVKYVSRYKEKGGIEDLRKAKHYIDMLIEIELGGD